MNLKDLQRHWHEFGRRDPLWAILTVDAKRNRGWGTEEFFQTGREEIAQVLAHIEHLGLARPHRRALDFGSGVGRLTQALCEQVGCACGVDIAPSMIKQARQHNRYGERCEYVLNDADDLRCFSDASFDFIYSRRVLQHMHPDYSTRYVREFLRVLAPGGVAAFQVPTAPSHADRALTAASSTAALAPPGRVQASLASRMRAFIKQLRRRIATPGPEVVGPIMEMYCVSNEIVDELVAEAGCSVVARVPDNIGGQDWPGFMFYVTKPPAQP